MAHKLSIVIIGRNEERGIHKCFEAAVAAASRIGSAEMIYVDSHSTDSTISIATEYGLTAIPLGQDLRLSPSAGRFWGSRQATGDFILFLDADTLIDPDFLPEALPYFAADASTAGVNGFIDDFTEAGEQIYDIDERFDTETDVKWLRGPACLYRRAALVEVDSFDPGLATEEEAELGLRLIGRGWKLKLIPRQMATHTRCHHVESITSIANTFVRDIRSGRLGEITRTVIHAFRAGNGLDFCWLRLRTTVLFLVWVLLAAISLLLPMSLTSLLLFGLVVAAGLILIFFKKRSIYQTLIFFPSKVLCLIDLMAGIPKMIRPDAKPSAVGGRSA